MGNGCLQLSDRISRCFSPQENESIKNLWIYVHMLSASTALKQREDRLSNSNCHYPSSHSVLARTLLTTTFLETAVWKLEAIVRSSPWAHQFMQLRKRSLKKFRFQRDSNPWPPRILVRCSTNWATKPHIGSQIIFVGSIFPMKEIDERINLFLFFHVWTLSSPPRSSIGSYCIRPASCYNSAISCRWRWQLVPLGWPRSLW